MYTISFPSGTIRKDGVIVPMIDTAPEYQAYVTFLMAGGTPAQIPDEVNPPRPPHATCTPWQLRRAMNARGLRESVDSLVSTLDQDAQDGFHYATTFESDDPMMLAAVANLGWGPDELHEFISYAGTLNKNVSV